MKKRNHKPYFVGKSCMYCKKPAKIYRSTEGNNDIICEERTCDIKSRIKSGLIKDPTV